MFESLRKESTAGERVLDRVNLLGGERAGTKGTATPSRSRGALEKLRYILLGLKGWGKEQRKQAHRGSRSKNILSIEQAGPGVQKEGTGAT